MLELNSLVQPYSQARRSIRLGSLDRSTTALLVPGSPHHEQSDRQDQQSRSLGREQIDASIESKRRISLITERRNLLLEIGLKMVDLISICRMYETLVCPEVDLVSMACELIRTQLAVLVGNDLIGIAVAHEDRRVLVRVLGGNHILDLLLQKQVAAKTKNSAQLVLVCDTRQQRHSASLRESSNNDSVCRDALRNFGIDERVEVITRLQDAGFVLFAVGESAEGLDVVPSWHAHAHVLALSATLDPDAGQKYTPK